jgi:hypothetical protein
MYVTSRFVRGVLYSPFVIWPLAFFCHSWFGIRHSKGGSPRGRVERYPKDGQGGEPVASGEIARDGTFVIGTYTSNDGMNPGTHIVTVLPVTYKSGNPTQAVPARLVPKQYTEPETSLLLGEIKAEDSVLAPFVLR